ncbi:BAG family molecular chaperone regulator 1 [Aphelenchoides fujianensis]|nr:BAG family molecular chaperone regulator 1 [Aphelenchoides fujianensis]
MKIAAIFQRKKKIRAPMESVADITIDDCLGKKVAARVLAVEAEADGQPDGEQPADGPPLLRTVGELRDLIGAEWDVDPNVVKIIHRGKQIGFEPDERLSALRFKPKDAVKFLGKPSPADPGMKALQKYERENLVKLNKLFEQNGKDVEMLEKNFLDGKNREELLRKTEKTLKQFNETAEKHLEAIDGLAIFGDQTPDHQKVRNREKRKTLVDGVLQLLNLNDKFLRRLDDYRFKMEHPDEGR